MIQWPTGCEKAPKNWPTIIKFITLMNEDLHKIRSYPPKRKNKINALMTLLLSTSSNTIKLSNTSEKAAVDNDSLKILVAAAQKGDKIAFERVYEEVFPKIWNYTKKRVSDFECEDIVGDIFLKIVQNLNKYKPQKVTFMAWAYRIAHNTIIDFYRRKKELVESDLSTNEDQYSVFTNIADNALTPSEQLQKQFEREQILEAIEELQDEAKAFVELKFLEGFNNQEIAHIMNKSRGAIRIMQFRALKSMKIIMAT